MTASGKCAAIMADGLPCSRTIVDGHVCVMHAVNEDKPKPPEFFAELQRVVDGTTEYARQTNLIDATGFYFPAETELILSEFHWNRPVSFKGASFWKAQFDSAIFADAVDFAATVFRYAARGGAVFEGPANFEGADFDTLKFIGAEFKKAVNFSRARTMEDSYLQRCVFRASAVFDAMRTGELHCHGSQFNGPVSLRNAVIRHAGGFASVEFAGPIDAAGLRVNYVSDCDPFFRSVHDIDLTGAAFQSPMSFRGTTFQGESRFDNVHFEADATFTGASFHRAALFAQGRFAGSADFSRVTFKDGCIFQGSRFSKQADFSDSCVSGVADLQGCKFGDPSAAYFVRVNENQEQGVRLRLADCAFDLANFEGVHWFRQGERLVLQDELDAETKTPRQLESIESAYRRLYGLLRANHRYSDAEDCVTGAMEMRRLNPRVDRLTRTAMYLYKMASFYGNSYRRATTVLAIIVLTLFPAIFMTSRAHLRIEGSAADVWHVRMHSHSLMEGTGEHRLRSVRDRIRLWEDAAFYSAELATLPLQQQTSYRVSGIARLAALVEPVVVAAQVALLLLALRRRFAQ